MVFKGKTMKNITIQTNDYDDKCFLRYDNNEYTFNSKDNNKNLFNYDYTIKEKIFNFLKTKTNAKKQIFSLNNKNIIFTTYQLNNDDFNLLENFLYCKYKYNITYNYYGILSYNRKIEIYSNTLLDDYDVEEHIKEITPKMLKNKDVYFLNINLEVAV